ncbi:MAG: MgtE intracellular region [Deltaproteobacteria bacterium]|jgi:CBS domain-containing protein/sporulation protein YlmC with PRC-barrel domain|nr:MgtE intracellular region [Deltaproteobacteria bacterium]
MAYVTEVYASEVLSKDVIDQYGRKAGVLWDLLIGPGAAYPCILKLVLRVNGDLCEVEVENLHLFNKFIITIKRDEGRLKSYDYREGDILVKKHVLDKQILDVNGAKVVRVNDVKLGESDGTMCVLGIDVGLNGILRRIDAGRSIQKAFSVVRKPIKDQIINWNFLQSVDPHLKNLTLTVARKQLSQLHPSDLAAILTEIPPERGEELLSEVSEELAGEALHELHEDVREKILNEMDKEKIADILEEMPPDEAADLLDDMPEERSKELLSMMEKDDAAEVTDLLSYEEDTAGGLMTSEFLEFAPDMTIEEVLTNIRLMGPEVDFIYYVYVVDSEEHLLGAVSLKRLLTNAFDVKLEEIMIKNTKFAHLDLDVKEVADIFSKYDLIALPVLDEQERLKGVITIDDVFDLLVPNPTRRRRKRKGSF